MRAIWLQPDTDEEKKNSICVSATLKSSCLILNELQMFCCARQQTLNLTVDFQPILFFFPSNETRGTVWLQDSLPVNHACTTLETTNQPLSVFFPSIFFFYFAAKVITEQVGQCETLEKSFRAQNLFPLFQVGCWWSHTAETWSTDSFD